MFEYKSARKTKRLKTNRLIKRKKEIAAPKQLDPLSIELVNSGLKKSIAKKGLQVFCFFLYL